MGESYKEEVFKLENQFDGWDEETFLYVQETPDGKVEIRVGGEEEANVFIETFGEEVRILIYRDFENEPEVIILDAVSGGW